MNKKNKIIIISRLGVLPFFVFLLFFAIHISSAEADTCTASATGNWNTAGTWTCDTAPTNHVPLSTDDVIVTSAVATTITVDTAAVAKSVTITHTGVAGTSNVILAVGANSLTISSGGGLTITGAAAGTRNAQVTVSTGTITVPGSVTFNNTRAQFISTGASTTNIGGNFGSGGTLTTSGTGTINFNGGVAQTAGVYTTYNNIQINNTSGGVSVSGATTFGGTLLISTGTLDTDSATFIVTGATTVTGTISFSNTAGSKTFNNDVTVNGTWSNTANEIIAIAGNLTVNTGATFTAGTAVYTLSGTTKTIGGTITSLSIPSLTVTGTYTNNILTTGLTVSTALAGAGTLTQGASSILNIGGTSTVTTLNASVSTNEVHYTSTTGAQTIKTSTYHHLFIDKSGQTATVGTPGITVNGNLTVTDGNLSDGGFQITGNATGTLTIPASSTLTLGLTTAATTFPTAFTNANILLNATSTVNYNSTSAQTISNVPTYGNLTLTGASVTKTAAGAFTVNGIFTNATATGIFADGGFTITLKDGAVMTGTHTGTGKILFTGGSAAHSVSGAGYNNVELDDSNGVTQSASTTIAGTFTITSGIWTSTNTISVTGITSIFGTLTISSATGTKTLGDITINSGGTMSLTTAIETVTINGNLTISSGGTMSFSVADIIPLFGNLTINGTGTITGASGLWTFQKVGGGTIGGTATAITIPGAATFTTAYTLPSIFTIDGTMTVDTGVNETNVGTVTANGALAGAGTFTQSSSGILNVRSITITTLNATATSNIVHLIGGVGGAIKGTSYVNLDINKTTGFTATASGTVNVTGNLTVTSGTISFANSTFTVTGTTDIFGTLTDTSGGGAGGNNIFNGLVTIHSGGIWLAVIGEVCDFHFSSGLVMDGASFTSSTGIYYFETNSQSITGSSSFTIDNLSVTGISLTNNSTGTLTVTNVLSGTGEFIQGANAVLNIVGTSTITTFTASAGGNTVNYTGSTAQTVHAGTYQTLNVSGNTNGSVDITADTTVNTVLTLGATRFSTALNKIILALGATVSRTSGYVIGTLEKNFNSSTSFTFPVGDVSNYAPIDLTLTGVSGSSSIDGSVTALDHADTTADTSLINKDKSINRYWSLVNNGLTFTSYDSVFNFVSGDVDVGGTVTDMLVSKKTGGVWTILPASCSGTSCTITGITTMSDFQIGEELDVTPPTIASIDSDAQTFTTSDTSPHTIRVTFSEDISNTPTISVSPDGGIQTVNDCSDVDDKTFCFSFTIPADTESTETITVSDAEDLNSNIMASNFTHTFIVDTINTIVTIVNGGGGGSSGRRPIIPNLLFPNLGSTINNNLPNPSLPQPLQAINNFLFPSAGQSKSKNINIDDVSSTSTDNEIPKQPTPVKVILEPVQSTDKTSSLWLFLSAVAGVLILLVSVYLIKWHVFMHTPLRIAYYNGTEKVGLERNVEKIIKNKFSNLKTVGLSNASRLDYKGTRVIDLSGKYSKEAAKVAKFVKGVVIPMPTGEVQPDADILIISGK